MAVVYNLSLCSPGVARAGDWKSVNNWLSVLDKRKRKKDTQKPRGAYTKNPKASNSKGDAPQSFFQAGRNSLAMSTPLFLYRMNERAKSDMDDDIPLISGANTYLRGSVNRHQGKAGNKTRFSAVRMAGKAATRQEETTDLDEGIQPTRRKKTSADSFTPTKA